MYADRYTSSGKLSPAGIIFALAGSGLAISALSLSAPNFIRKIDVPFIGRNIPLSRETPPPPHPVPPQAKVAKTVATPRDPIDVTRPAVTVATGAAVDTHTGLPPQPTVIVGTGGDAGTTVAVHAAVLRDPVLDARYIDSFQPNYPSDERIAGRTGRVVVRVLIGTDGRVKQVEQVGAASAAFFEATRRQALAKWRFKPGTRDGVAVEAWHTMAVRFVMEE